MNQEQTAEQLSQWWSLQDDYAEQLSQWWSLQDDYADQLSQWWRELPLLEGQSRESEALEGEREGNSRSHKDWSQEIAKSQALK